MIPGSDTGELQLSCKRAIMASSGYHVAQDLLPWSRTRMRFYHSREWMLLQGTSQVCGQVEGAQDR